MAREVLLIPLVSLFHLIQWLGFPKSQTAAHSPSTALSPRASGGWNPAHSTFNLIFGEGASPAWGAEVAIIVEFINIKAAYASRVAVEATAQGAAGTA